MASTCILLSVISCKIVEEIGSIFQTSTFNLITNTCFNNAEEKIKTDKINQNTKRNTYEL